VPHQLEHHSTLLHEKSIVGPAVRPPSRLVPRPTASGVQGSVVHDYGDAIAAGALGRTKGLVVVTGPLSQLRHLFEEEPLEFRWPSSSVATMSTGAEIAGRRLG
jgi:hypothetical protein